MREKMTRVINQPIINCYEGSIAITREKKADIIALLKYINPLFHPFYYNLMDGNVEEEDPDIELNEMNAASTNEGWVDTPTTPMF